jgi:dipeptidyl aminopeptidase/acylaminoacyl peptidase
MPTPPGRYAAIEAASSPVFTRDGRTLLFLRGAGLTQLWALDLGSGTVRQITDHDEKVAMVRRSPVDDRVIYGIDAGGDERQQLWLVDPASPSARALTADPRASHEWGGWSPDGARIALAANTRDPAHFDVFVQDVQTGERRCVWEGQGIVGVSGFRSDGKRLAIVPDRAQGDQELLILDLETGMADPVPQPGPTSWQSVRWSSDGRTLLALTDHGGSDFLRLCRVDPESGTVSEVHAAPGRDVEAYAISPDGTQLATIENDRGYGILRAGPIEGERPAVTGLPRGVTSDPAFSPDGSMLAFAAAAPTEPAGLWILQGGKARPVWQPDPGLDPGALVDWELVGWSGEDGTPVPGWLALPPGPVPEGGHRAVIWVHGGPASQVRPNFRPDIQMLIDQGYAVLLPNVRGSTGYGRRSTESDDGAKRPATVADLVQGRHWLAAHPAIDGERIAIMGQSYGGFMVNAAITWYPDLWKAAINYYGIVDFATTLEGTGPWRRSHRAAEYADPAVPDLFATLSPIHRIDEVRVPVLAAHGTRDPRVPMGESEQLVKALQERQRPVTYLTFDYAGHGFIRPEDRRRIYAAVTDFLAAHV